MTFTTKNLLATAVALVFAAPAFAGASLDSLLGGGTLTSNNGKLVFSDFTFTPGSNVVASNAAAIDVTTLDSGLLFGSPIFIDSATGIVEFDLAYKATGIGATINGASIQTSGAYSGDAQASATKVIQDGNGIVLAELTNLIATGNTSDSAAAAFAAQGSVSVGDSFSAAGGGGTGANGFVDVSQTFTTEDIADETIVPEKLPTAVPSPTAALAGLALLGIVGLRRRRG